MLRCTAGGMLRNFLVIGGLHIVLKDAFGGHGSVGLARTTGLSYCARLCIFALKFMSVLLRFARGVQCCSAAGALGWQHGSPPTLCLQELANNKLTLRPRPSATVSSCMGRQCCSSDQ